MLAVRRVKRKHKLASSHLYTWVQRTKVWVHLEISTSNVFQIILFIGFLFKSRVGAVCTTFWIERTGFIHWPGSLFYVLEQDTLLSQYLSVAVTRATILSIKFIFYFRLFSYNSDIILSVNDDLYQKCACEAEHTFLYLCTYPGHSCSVFRRSFVSCCWRVTCAVEKKKHIV